MSIAGVSYFALASLSSTDVAFIDRDKAELCCYTFDGTNWSQKGNGLSITSVGKPALASLSSTDVAFIDEGNDELRCYTFNGADWTQKGNGLSIASVSNVPALASLNSTDVAFIDDGNDELRTYSFLFGYDSASVNIAADYEVPELATGKSIVIRRTSAYNGNPVTITPPSGATFEGRASLSLYGQYSFVELERISSAVFAIREWKDKYPVTPVLTFGGASVGITYSVRTCIVTRNGHGGSFIGRITLSSKGTSVGFAAISGVPGSGLTGTYTVCSIYLGGVTYTGQYFGALAPEGAIRLYHTTEAAVESPLVSTDFANNAYIAFQGNFTD